MKAALILILSFAFCLVKSQSLIGTWQVTKQTNCLEREVSDSVQMNENLLKEFSSKSTRSPKVMIFRADNSAEESIRELDKKRSKSVKKFHYKQDGNNIYILDKKSHLIVSGLIIETLTSDSLVYYTAGKECEKTFFVRIE
jgi:hypothetical protein